MKTLWVFLVLFAASIFALITLRSCIVAPVAMAEITSHYITWPCTFYVHRGIDTTADSTYRVHLGDSIKTLNDSLFTDAVYGYWYHSNAFGVADSLDSTLAVAADTTVYVGDTVVMGYATDYVITHNDYAEFTGTDSIVSDPIPMPQHGMWQDWVLTNNDSIKFKVFSLYSNFPLCLFELKGDSTNISNRRNSFTRTLGFVAANVDSPITTTGWQALKPVNVLSTGKSEDYAYCMRMCVQGITGNELAHTTKVSVIVSSQEDAR